MTPTERLRALLDDYGVPWSGDDTMTEWGYEEPHAAIEDIVGTLQVTGLTPEMAIAATLDETCHDAGLTPYIFVCSECGANHWRNIAFIDMPRYCPCCGRRVMEDVE